LTDSAPSSPRSTGPRRRRWEKTGNECRTDQTCDLHRRTHLPGGRRAHLQGLLRYDVKRRWFAEGEDWRVEEFTADFRPGGYETSRFRFADGPPITYDTRYLDIITDERLVFSYTMTIDGRPSSVSLASVELFPAQGETRLVYTEQGQYFQGGDQALQREIGCGELYDTLGEVLASAH